MGVAALVLGIISIILSFTPIAWIGIIAGVVGIVLAVLERKKAPSGIATGGLVTSIIGTVLSAILFLACVLCVAAMKKGIDDPAFQKSFQQELEKVTKDPNLKKSLEELNKELKKK